MYVLDASIFSSIIIKDEFYDKAEKFLVEHFRDGNITLDLVIIEVANVLWKHTYILNRIPYEKYFTLKGNIKPLIFSSANVYNSMDFLDEAMDNSIKLGITIYDSLYVTVALSRNSKIVTFDDTLKSKLVEKGLKDVIYQLQ
ncbi:MAG: type II toxin-antitoxin system VapC family toxin [Candidatus Methanomethylicia archaeon]